MPVRNDAAFIEQSLASVMAQDFPTSQVEILVVDGMSEDGTRQIVEDVVRGQAGPSSFVSGLPTSVPGPRSPVLRLLKNPNGIVPCALNLAIKAARGQWLVRLDAHSIYPPDYIRRCIETAQRTGADNVGGVVAALPRDGSAGACLVQALSTSSFGVGGARFRVGGEEGPADTVAFGCFRREVFDEVGLFDERLVRNQDYEFNRRLARAGKRIWFNPAIRAEYFNQATLGGLFGQAFGTGKWNPWVWFVAPYAFAVRHLVPGLFVLGLVIVLSSWFLVPWGWVALAAIMVPYVVLALVASVQQGRRYGFGLALPLPALFFAYHFSYGLGTLWGALRLLVGATPVQKVREPWPGAGRFRAWPKPARK
jgi:glycosyltransferase involved in cell wall biosynthesis